MGIRKYCNHISITMEPNVKPTAAAYSFVFIELKSLSQTIDDCLQPQLLVF